MSALRMVTPPDAHSNYRALLAERDERAAAIGRLSDAVDRARSVKWKAHAAVNAAHAALAAVKKEQAAAMAADFSFGGAGVVDSGNAREARAAVQEAQDHFDAASAALIKLQADLEDAEATKHGRRLLNALADYLEPTARAIINRAIETDTAAKRARQTLMLFQEQQVLAGDLAVHARYFLEFGARPVPSRGAPLPFAQQPIPAPDVSDWRMALNKLREDPDTQLPAL